MVTLQDAVYVGGSLLALAAALVIAVAVRGRATLFAVAVWAAAAAVSAALVAATLRVRHRWVSVEQVVRFADRRAALDDRLATLLLDPARARASRLRDILLEQILAAAPRWDVDTLAPRRVPRSLFALLAALSALIATSFLVRPPATPQPASAAMRPRPLDEDPTAGVLRPRPAGSESGNSEALVSSAGSEHGGVGADQPSGASGPEEGRQETFGESTRRLSGKSGQQRAGSSEKAGTDTGLENPGLSPQAPPSASGSSPNLADGAPDGMAGKLQDAIRQAMGAPDAQQNERGENPGGQRTDDPVDQQGSGSGEQARHSPAESTSKDGRSDKGLAPPDAQASIPGTGSAANPGANAGQAATALFSKEGSSGTGERESPSLPLKLGAFAAMQPSQVEPQRHLPPNSVPFTAGDRGAPPPLSDEQIPDAPLQKADVAPEHEAVVRRIFTRE